MGPKTPFPSSAVRLVVVVNLGTDVRPLRPLSAILRTCQWRGATRGTSTYSRLGGAGAEAAISMYYDISDFFFVEANSLVLTLTAPERLMVPFQLIPSDKETGLAPEDCI